MLFVPKGEPLWCSLLLRIKLRRTGSLYNQKQNCLGDLSEMERPAQPCLDASLGRSHSELGSPPRTTALATCLAGKAGVRTARPVVSFALLLAQTSGASKVGSGVKRLRAARVKI